MCKNISQASSPGLEMAGEQKRVNFLPTWQTWRGVVPMSHIHFLCRWMCTATYGSQWESDLSLHRLSSHQYSPPLCIRGRGRVKSIFLGFNPDKCLRLRTVYPLGKQKEIIRLKMNCPMSHCCPKIHWDFSYHPQVPVLRRSQQLTGWP